MPVNTGFFAFCRSVSEPLSAGKETRTLDPFITSEVLYRLSYSSSKNYYTKYLCKMQALFFIIKFMFIDNMPESLFSG